MTQRSLPPKAHVIPAEAEKVFEGVIFDVYQWQQEMFDGTVETFEMLKRPDTVVVVAIDENNKIVVIDEEQPGGVTRYNSLPKGRVDNKDETTLSAAKREMLEETGMEFSDWYLLQISQFQSKIEWFVYVYVAQNKIAQHEPVHDAGEKISVKTVEFEELKNTNNTIDRDIKAIKESSDLEEFLAGLLQPQVAVQ